MPKILVTPTPETPFIVMTSSAKMPRSVRVPYVHVAVVETDGETAPKMLSRRARGVKGIVWRSDGPQHVGGERSAAARAVRTAVNIAFRRNRLHMAKIGVRPITLNEIIFAENETARRDYVAAYDGPQGKGLHGFLEAAGAEILHRDQAGVLVRALLPGADPLIAVIVKCPSTGQIYALRVPPYIRRARDAVAWTFDMDPHSYQLRIET